MLSAMGRYRESLDIQNKILSMRGAGTFMPFHKLYQRMARNYKGLGDIERMGEAYERSIAIADSLHGLEIDNQLSEFDVKYAAAHVDGDYMYWCFFNNPWFDNLFPVEKIAFT